MTLEDFDAGRSSEDCGEQGRMIDVGVPRERGVQREEPLHLVARGPRHKHVAHGSTVVERLDRKEPRYFLPVFVDVLEQEPVGPHTEPGVDALGSQSSVFRVQFFERLLNALESVLGHVGHRGAEIEHAAPTDGRRLVAVLHVVVDAAVVVSGAAVRTVRRGARHAGSSTRGSAAPAIRTRTLATVGTHLGRERSHKTTSKGQTATFSAVSHTFRGLGDGFSVHCDPDRGNGAFGPTNGGISGLN